MPLLMLRSEFSLNPSEDAEVGSGPADPKRYTSWGEVGGSYDREGVFLEFRWCNI